MGVTIHFEGRLKDEVHFENVLRIARKHAAERSWRTDPIEMAVTVLHRVRDEADWDYEGPVRGLVIFPHDDCDPLRLEFDKDLYVQEFVKTQFAGEAVHLAVIDLLRVLEPEFERLEVDDEGEFWKSGDQGLLSEHFQSFERALQGEVEKHPNARVKVKLADGRIVDLMT